MMYNEYFGFKETPFSIAPDPRYLYMTEQHREALAHLVYGVSSEGGCMLLTGEVGTGKTTICRGLLEHVPQYSNIALVFNPKVTAIELLETICDELKIEYPESGNSIKTYIDRINRFLLDAHARSEKTVLIIDEAQNLDSSVLEQLRLLTNLETDQRKLLQIIILGQPELLEILSRQDMRQLAQRITARFHLKALSREEIKAYVNHRLAVAGQNAQLFPDKTIEKLYRLSKGIPRVINVLCDRSLLGAYVQNERLVSPYTLEKAAVEVFGEIKNTGFRNKKAFQWQHYIFPAAAVAGLVAIFMYFLTPVNFQTNTGEASIATAPQDLGDQAHSSASPSDAPNSVAAMKDSASSEKEIAPVKSETASSENNLVDKNLNQEDITATQNTSPEDQIASFISSLKDNNQDSAFATLFKLWGYEFSQRSSEDACTYAQNIGLSCLQKSGNLRSIEQLNRPALLKLYGANGKNAYIIVTRLDHKEITINTGKEEIKTNTHSLDKYWLGEYTILWQMPPFYDHALQQGSQGPLVQWLDQVLVRMYGQSSVPTIHDTYAGEIIEKVKKFQKSKGLIADGVAGPITFIHLNNELGIKAPSLKTRES